MGLAVPAPSNERSEALASYIAELRGLMALGHWTVRVVWEYPDREDGSGAIQAEIDPTEGRYLACLRLGEGFLGLPAEDTRTTLVHELLHLHHVGLTDVIDRGRTKLLLGEPAHAILADVANREAELMVDSLTSVIAEHLPLPGAWPA